jgi:hypothetical protein
MYSGFNQDSIELIDIIYSFFSSYKTRRTRMDILYLAVSPKKAISLCFAGSQTDRAKSS